MAVDEPREDDAAAAVDSARGLPRAVADRDDPVARDRDVGVLEHAPLVVHRHDAAPREEQVAPHQRPAADETNAAMAAIWRAVSRPRNGGITPRPSVTRATTSSPDGFASSR